MTDHHDNTKVIKTGKTDDGKFSFVRQVNKHQQEQGIDPPLTVIEFSMTDACRDELQALLEDFVEGKKTIEDNSEELQQAIEDNFPKEVLEYFKDIKTQDIEAVAPYVYVVHNLPELPEKEVEAALDHAIIEPGIEPDNPDCAAHAEQAATKSFSQMSTYAPYIARGVALATSSTYGHGPIIRPVSPPQYQGFNGNSIHKHADLFSGLSVMYQRPGTSTKTKFIDLYTAAKNNTGQQENSKEALREILNNKDKHYTSQACNTNDGYEVITLQDQGITEQDIEHNSLSVEAKNGSMVLWSNKGRIYHEALRTTGIHKDMQPCHIARAAMYHVFDGYDPPTP